MQGDIDRAIWRAKRAEAFKAGDFSCRVPDVATARWDAISWCNWVKFNDPSLNGFDDRVTK